MEKLLEKAGNRSWVPAGTPLEALPQAAVAELRERFDRERGGFAGLSGEQEDGALLFLLEYARRAEDDWARGMAEAVLDRRREGGPLLACAHLEAYAQTGRSVNRETACRLLDRARAAGRLPAGGFTEAGDGVASVGWNARILLALAKASRVLGDGSALREAREARLFVKTRLTQSNGRLWRRWRKRTPMEEGRMADYAFYCWALAELYEADFAVSYLREAEGMAERMTAIFRDQQGGLYDLTDLSGEGAAALALARLAQLTALTHYRRLAWEQLAWLSGGEVPDGLALLGAVEVLVPRRTLLCACGDKIPDWLAPVGEEYRLAPVAKTAGNAWGLANVAPFTSQFPVPEMGERLYLCRDGVCEMAAEDLPQLCRRLSPDGVAIHGIGVGGRAVF